MNFTLVSFLFALFICHLIGDYVLQCDYLAKQKAVSWYHMIAHCTLYVSPFCWLLGGKYIVFLWLSHFIIDVGKARYYLYNELYDQFLHILMLEIIFLIMVMF